MAGEDHIIRPRGTKRGRMKKTINPQCYPQSRHAGTQTRFNLRLANGPLSSPSDRSRLVLPNVTIAKVGLAWVPPPLPAAHQVAGSILVPGRG